MFETRTSKSMPALVFSFLEVTFYASVRNVRKTHGNAVLAILISIVQSLLFIAAFYLMFTLMGTRTAALRGNFMIYLMSGIFLYLTHIQTVNGVMGAEGPTSPMMQHGPMTTLVSICAAAISVLYTKFISVLCILLLIHTVIEPVHIANWPGALGMFILAWATGVVIGLLFMGMKPWMPDAVQIMALVYTRANMIFSGKMFLASAMPSMMLPAFTWNPLFHVIDQMRGFVFKNYFADVTNYAYPLYFVAAALILGMMLESYTRKNASASWEARR